MQGSLAPVRDPDGRTGLVATMAFVSPRVAAGATSISVHLKGIDPGLDDPAHWCAALVDAFRAAI